MTSFLGPRPLQTAKWETKESLGFGKGIGVPLIHFGTKSQLCEACEKGWQCSVQVQDKLLDIVPNPPG